MNKSLSLHNTPILNVWIWLVELAAAMLFPHPSPWRRGGCVTADSSQSRNGQPFHGKK
jgi:hypothetical protein